MTDPLAFVAGWIAAWEVPVHTDIAVKFSAGEPSLPKTAVWVEAESTMRSGQLTVWESGETEIEVYTRRTMDIVLMRSEIVESNDRLRELLSELIEKVGGRL